MVMAFAKLRLDSTAIYLLPRVRLDDVTKLRATIMAFVIAAVVASLILGVVLILIAPFLWRGEVAATVRALMIFCASWFGVANCLGDSAGFRLSERIRAG